MTKWLIPQHRQVSIQANRSWLPRSPHRWKEDPHGRSQGQEGQRLETTMERNQSSTLPRLHRVLLLLHQRILPDCMTLARPDQAEHCLALGNRSAKSLQRTSNQNVWQTSPNESRSNENVLPPNQCVIQWSRSSPNPMNLMGAKSESPSLTSHAPSPQQKLTMTFTRRSS